MSLFDTSPAAHLAGSAAAGNQRAPLAERLRPRTLDEYTGQDHLLGPGKPLRLAIDSRRPRLHDLLGTARRRQRPPSPRSSRSVTEASFIEFSAVLSGIKEIKQVMVEAEKARSASASRTILFVDEIHRFNKAQQDAFLPYVERGTIRLIGATTENPSFEINAALL